MVCFESPATLPTQLASEVIPLKNGLAPLFVFTATLSDLALIIAPALPHRMRFTTKGKTLTSFRAESNTLLGAFHR
jgi:hypothetical protein